MKRDFDRYVVIKNSHAEHALTEEERRELYRLGMKCANWRKQIGKKPFECVVVEHDWPEYEKVWRMIEDRVDGFGAKPSLEELERKAALFDQIRDLMGYVQNGTDTSVTLFQDDATQWFTVAIGRSHERKGESAPSLEAAIRTMHHKYGGD